jgi:ketosteroid isomerase-like protein
MRFLPGGLVRFPAEGPVRFPAGGPTRSFLICAALPVLFCACGTHVDMDAAREAVRKADADFSKASERRDFNAWLAFVAEDARFFASGGVREGRRQVGDAWKPFFAPGGPKLVWEPTLAEVSRSGDLGYTSGRYLLTAEGPGGAEESRGRYVTIWRKGTGERWQVVMDIGNPDEPDSSR